MNPLATYLARAIFECGDQCNDKAQRLEFKGGTYPDSETALGGLCESSLESFLDHLIARYQANPEGQSK